MAGRTNRSGGTTRIIIGIVAVIVVLGVAAFGYIYVTGGSGEASREIDAPTLAVAVSATEEATAEAAVADASSASDAAAPSESQGVIFNIVPEESEVRFTLTEELRGQPTTVIGRTDQVAGQLLVNFDNPPASQVGLIRINARTLATDNEMRNRAIRGQILLSARDEYEFAEFMPTALSGLPESVTIGEPFTFQITGDLKVREFTNSVTFDVTATAVSETEIEGTATAVVQRSMYGMTIPSAPGVANVSENVTLEIEFTAVAAE